MTRIKGKILLDRSHGLDYGFQTPEQPDLCLTYLSSLLKKLGCQCHDLNEGPISYDELKRYNALWLDSKDLHTQKRDGRLLDEEIRDIKRFVYEKDGGLFLMYRASQFGSPFIELRFEGLVHDYGMFRLKGKWFENLPPEGNILIEEHQTTRLMKNSSKDYSIFTCPFNGIIDHELGWLSYTSIDVKPLIAVEKDNALYHLFAVNERFRVACLMTKNFLFNDNLIINNPTYEHFAKGLFPWLCGVEEPEPSKKFPFMY